jgi:hypothetical protein
MKPSNESNYLLVDGKPIWYHLSLLFDRNTKIYFFLDKKLKGQPKLEGVTLNIKCPVRQIISEIYHKELPDKLVIVDDSIVFNTQVAETIKILQDSSILFNPLCLVDKLSICGIINSGRVQNLTYGINKHEIGIFQSSNIYVLTNPLLSKFVEKYTSPAFTNYVLFEVFNNLIIENHSLIADINELHKLLSIKSSLDLDKVKKIIHENINSSH